MNQIIDHKYIKILNKKIEKNEISFWKIKKTTNRKYNSYFINNFEKESSLKSINQKYTITIYVDYKNKIGESNFVLSDNFNEEEFNKELEETIFISQFSKSEKYNLPKKDNEILNDKHININEYINKKFIEDFNNDQLENFIDKEIINFKKIINKNQQTNIYINLNQFEFFNQLSSIEILNCNNLYKKYIKNNNYLEFVLTSKNINTEDEKEYIVYQKINDIYSFDFDKLFTESIEISKDVIRSEKIKNFKGKVILNKHACIDFFNPDLTMNSVVAYASARLKYLGILNQKLNEKIIQNKYDSLTIYSNSLLYNNTSAIPYDDDLIPATKTCLIENNNFKNYFASKQYSDYLNINPTGPFGVIEIFPGKKTIQQLIQDKDTLIEIISFSSFVPDILTGNFSAEIRLGYIRKNNKKIPFSGGLFSGNIFELLKEIELSKEIEESVGYKGPKAIKFHNADIIGNT